MRSKLFSRTGLVVLAVVALCLVAAIQIFVKGMRFDLTEGSLYTLTQGTKKLVGELEQPVNLKFYFSAKQAEGVPQLRNYAARVKELLQEYVRHSGGRVALEVIDPEPFSEEEDEAASYGLQKVPLSNGGREVFMGLVAEVQSPASGESAGQEDSARHEVIGFFSLEKEKFLEYDISHLIYGVSQSQKPKLGLISSVSVSGGGFDMATRQPSESWMSIEQLKELYEVQDLGATVTEIADDISVLLLILPNLSEQTQYAVDQYILRGGHALVFLDPFAESVGGYGGGAEKSAHLERLLGAWGVEMVRDRFVADEQAALSITAQNGRTVRHLGILGYGPDNFEARDAVMGTLKTVNFSSAGALLKKEGATISFEPLVQSSTRAALLDSSQLAMLFDPRTLYKDFQPDGERYTLIARLTGQVKTAFPDGMPKKAQTKPGANSSEDAGKAEKQEEHTLSFPHLNESSDSVNVILVSDTDVITNRLWVQVSNFFGQQVATPFASNGDMVVNMVDSLTGNTDLVAIRSRDEFSRPFVRVDELERRAQGRYTRTEELLNQQLKETENRLLELQTMKRGEEAQVISDEQLRELEKFQKEKLRIRKQLREVQHQLGRDIEALGDWLKLINILLVPLLLTLFTIVWRLYSRRRLA